MNGTYGTTTGPQTTGSKLIDDYLRRELRVGDPRNALEVVTALRKRYASAAARLDQETAGLPIRYEPQLVTPAPAASGDTFGSKEERRVQTNLDSDFVALIESRDNREWAPEIRGWRDTLMREVAEGLAAARLAQDPAMRDRSFLSARKLGEFARIARLVGVMNLPLNLDYRRLATALDEAANVIRIVMGEALFNAGLADGGLVIQVPVFELRDRRDALVLAVRRLSGTEISTENDDWGDALAAYRELLRELQVRGASELRVYLRPDLLASVLDGLVGEIARQDPDALRQVAATSPVEIARLTRLREIANDLLTTSVATNPITASLTLYVRTLELFLDGFAAVHGGARLIDLAMPLPLAAQQADEPDREGRAVLRSLVSLRGEYAREVECFLSGCGCGRDDLRCQVQLDKVLYDVDRAIDLYAQGSGIPPAWGPEERRAGAYSLIVENLANERGCITPVAVLDVMVEMARSALDLIDATARLEVAAGVVTPTPAGLSGLLRHVIAAAEAGPTSRDVSEGILRGLADVPPGVVITDPPPVNDRLSLVVVAARALPLRVEEAIQLLIDLIELIVGATTNNPGAPTAQSSVGAIAVSVVGVRRSAGGLGFDIVGPILTGLIPLFGNLGVTLNALVAARVALRAAMRAIGDPANIAANRQAALTAAGNVTTSIQLAVQALNPPPPAIVPVAERLALSDAIEACTAAHAAAVRVGGLPATEPIEPVALGRILTLIAAALRTGLPADPGERAAVVSAVFDEQLRSEQDWQTLVRALAPRCLGPGQTELALAGLDLLRASPRHLAVINTQRESFPDERVSLARIAANVDRFNGLVNDTVYRVTRFGNTLNRFARQAGLDQFAQDALDAARDAAEEAVEFARDENVIDSARTRFSQFLDSRRGRAGTYASTGRPPGGTAPSGGTQGPPPAQGQPPSQGGHVQTPSTSAGATSLPAISNIVQRIYPYCRTRGEIRDALEAQPGLGDEWQELKTKYKDAGVELDQEFVELVDDLLDTSTRAKLETRRVDAVLQRAVYPVQLDR